MDQHLNKITCCSVFEKLAVNFGKKKAYTAFLFIGVNLAASHTILKGDHVFSALFS